MYGVFRLNLTQAGWRSVLATPPLTAKIILAPEEGVKVKVAGLPSGPYHIPVHLVDAQLQDDRPRVVCYTDEPVLETEVQWDEIEYVVLDL
jgi:hypothetical protein